MLQLLEPSEEPILLLEKRSHSRRDREAIVSRPWGNVGKIEKSEIHPAYVVLSDTFQVSRNT